MNNKKLIEALENSNDLLERLHYPLKEILDKMSWEMYLNQIITNQEAIKSCQTTAPTSEPKK